MGREIDLLKDYPRTKRNIKERSEMKTEEDRTIARRFGKEFFDGDRRHGYGGFHYHPRFWQPVVPFLQSHFQLKKKSKVLDVGCAKGFMLYDMQQLIPEIEIYGIDISAYAIENALDSIKPHLQVGDAKNLPFETNSFDAVISINTIHNLEKSELAVALKEIQRVSNGRAFITVDAYRNDEEKEAMFAWNLTAKTMMHTDEWKTFFDEIGYTGDYYWFIP